MTESTNVEMKTEQPDEAEIRELAAKMAEANKAKALAASVADARPQPGALLCAPAAAVDEEMVIMMFPTITPGTQQQTPAEPRPTSNDKITPAPDEASWKGHFGWDTLGECHIPYIYRCGEKYVSLRMVEIKLLNKYLNCLHADLYSFTCIQSYYITAIEAQLLNEINNKYCDGQFGRDPFTQKDLVVRLKDAYEFYNFLDVCYNKLLRGTTNNEKCGFIMINKVSAVPYTVRDGKKFVPLFCFEGEIDNLKLKAEQLTGWDVSYLKFCCKVQGISNELFASETCSVISLTDIKSYFPPETEFEEYWPKKVFDSQLLNSVKDAMPSTSTVQSGEPESENIVTPKIVRTYPDRARAFRKKDPGSVLGGGQWTKAPPGPPPGAMSSVLPNNAIQVAIVQQLTPLVRSTANTTTMKTACNYAMADKPDEPMDLKDLPLPSTSDAPVETQDAAASTSATPFAKLRKKAPPKSSAQRQREYRQRIKASRTQSKATRISETERKRNYRLRKAAKLALASGSLESTTASSSRSAGRLNDVQNSIQRQLTNQQRQSLAAEPAQTTEQPGTSLEQIEVPDEPMDLKDLPLPSRNDAPIETQGAATSTSATPFAEPPTIAAQKSKAQRQREYRQRIAAFRTHIQLAATRISETERKRNYRLRKAANLAIASGSLESTSASSSRSAGRSNDVQNTIQRQLTNQQRQSLAAEPAQTTEQPGTSSVQIEVPDEPIDLKDLPLPSRSIATVETQDAAASTPAMPFAEPPKKAAPKSNAQRQREYRQRIAASRTAKSTATRILEIERVTTAPSSCSAGRSNDVQNSTATRISETERLTTAPSSWSAGRSNDVQNSTQRQLTNQQRQYVGRAQSIWNTKWASSIMRFKSTFLDNDFGYACSVCDRLWFKNDLKPITAAHLEVISERFVKENRQFCREEYEMVCNTCKRSLNKKSMPPLAKVNGFSYPNPPPDLPPLDPISERLISPCLPFMQVRRLRHDLSSGIIGQVINVPVDVQKMEKCLPRQLNEDDVINVNIKRNLAHKSVYISGYMSKITIKKWLTALQESSLYRLYKINVDFSRLNPTVPLLDNVLDNPSNRIENISAENTPESEILASRQHTMMWNEEDCLHIAQGHQAKPLNINYDRNVEELSFPSIYFGKPRRFKKGLSITPYMVANSEIRRRDRRGATPQKVLYVAMKLLRLRMVDGIHSTFRNVSVTENVTRRMLEDTEFLKEYVIQNLAFMKTVPNSVQYWASRKRDLFAMIRQLGKPTVFLTIGANEIRWMKLLTILLKLSKKYPEKTAKDLNTSERCTLVSDDPVTCCIYFYKLVDSLMKMLKSKQSYNPFEKYFVQDYFLRIEFQHQGSPHAHILLWLNDDPRETVSENMPRTIELVEKISSVARDDVPNNSIYANQIHKHTFTCTKRGETTCRFGIPYWPMPTTRVLVPMPQSDGRRQTLQQKAKELRASLGERRYACMDEFLNANGLTYDSYLDIVRSTLRRPTLVFRRNFDELMTNTFNPYLAGEVNSNIDIQFILDDYSCAEYVVEYIIKSARGMGNLRRELTTMMQQHPDRDYTGQLKALSIKLLNAVEMSAQEAAWYLLRQPMSEESRPIVYIPTVWPTERQRCRKRRQQMDREGIDEDSTDVWTKNIIQRYEERPASLEQVYLAEFASWYAKANDFVDEEDDVHVDDDEDSEAVPEVSTSRAPKEYRRRLLGRVIRYRRYDIDETVDYKREMVLLYVQFRNEISEILDQNKFLRLFDDNKDTIMERRSLFETNLNIENVTKELEAMMILQNDNDSNLQEEESRAAFVQRSLGEDGDDNVDGVNQSVPRQGFSIAKSRSNRSDSDTNAAGEVAMYRMSKVLQVALSSTTGVIKNTDDV